MLLNSNLNCKFISQEETKQNINSLSFNQEYFSFISHLLDPSNPFQPSRLTLPKIKKISKDSSSPVQTQQPSPCPALQSIQAPQALQSPQTADFMLSLESSIQTPIYKGNISPLRSL